MFKNVIQVATSCHDYITTRPTLWSAHAWHWVSRISWTVRDRDGTTWRKLCVTLPFWQTSCHINGMSWQDSFWAHRYKSKWLFHICWQNSQYKRSCLQTPPSHCRVDVRKCLFAERVLKPWNSLPAELHHFSSLSVFKHFIFSVDLSEFVTC